MGYKMFKKEFLRDVIIDDVVEEEIIDQSRWTTIIKAVFEHEGKFYETIYGRGSTEYQDEEPYEFEEDEVKCKEVHLKEVIVKKWVPVGE